MKLTSAFLLTLDHQDVFDVIGWRLLFQNARALAADGMRCMYRAPNGKRCAIGWIIPDDLYSPEFEFKGVRDIAAGLAETDYGRDFAAFVGDHVAMLCDLQGLHDAYPVSDWPLRLRLIAQKYELRETVIDRMSGSRPRYNPPAVIGPCGPVAPGCLLDLGMAAKLRQLPRAIVRPVEIVHELELMS
ncbi:hypothetical protein [Paraburkholderia bannensis]|uniref:hypothetical protein n=1 Tax=Paraburkholderia bannensis TaxID=765414 RepID=UPI002AC33537|nr:hypothetical protein [Paraburkholderia bannensis]